MMRQPGSPLPIAGLQDRHGRIARNAWRQAAALSFAAIACAVLLGGLSAWFLGAVALAGLSAAALTFNFHIPAALVRLFAVGRTAAKYGERVVGHQVALADQVARRARLFEAMAAAPAVRQAGWQLGDQSRLADYLDDVEDLDHARLRVDLPALAAGFGLAAGLTAALAVSPLALLPIAGHLLALAVAGRRLAADGALSWRTARSLRRRAGQHLGLALASAVPLQAEGAWPRECDDALGLLSQADGAVLDLRRRQAGFDALAALLGPVALLSIVGAAWLSGARGEALLVPAFAGFAWLALGESAAGASRMVIAQVRRRAAQAEMQRWASAPSPGKAVPAPPRFSNMTLIALRRRAPDGRRIEARLSAALRAGVPTIVTGASGCGKTSLLKQIAGWTGDDTLVADSRLLNAAHRRAASLFCPHDAAILADTVRANLFAPGTSDAELQLALEAVELSGRIEKAGGLDAWITQDALSLGEAQRMNLARAWLSDKPIVLLDEPTEHLDDAQGQRILGRLLEHLGDRIVVLSSHRMAGLPDTATIEL